MPAVWLTECPGLSSELEKIFFFLRSPKITRAPDSFFVIGGGHRNSGFNFVKWKCWSMSWLI